VIKRKTGIAADGSRINALEAGQMMVLVWVSKRQMTDSAGELHNHDAIMQEMCS